MYNYSYIPSYTKQGGSAGPASVSATLLRVATSIHCHCQGVQSTELYIPSTEPYILSKEPYILSKESYM